MLFKVIQGHRGPVPIKSLHATSYQWLILTDILSRTISKLSQITVQILDSLCFYRAAWNADAVKQWEFCPSVCPPNVCFVKKRKKDLSRFLYHMQDHLA